MRDEKGRRRFSCLCFELPQPLSTDAYNGAMVQWELGDIRNADSWRVMIQNCECDPRKQLVRQRVE